MPTWDQILKQLRSAQGRLDQIRRRYIKQLSKYTGRNVITYYSGWLQREDLARHATPGLYVDDSDKNGFMACIHRMDRSKGLDLLIHTPGGDVAATESLVDYLRAMFGTNIRVLVPQIALSAGTMIACAAREIVMGKHSSLGPIDPQIAGTPAHGIIEEFKTAREEILSDSRLIPIWQPIIAKYRPTLIGECQKAIAWADEIVGEWLRTGMFKGESNAEERARAIVRELGDHELTKAHNRHISPAKAREMGLKIVALEDDQKLQDLVLTVHHAYVHTFSATDAVKIIENHLGVGFVRIAPRATSKS